MVKTITDHGLEDMLVRTKGPLAIAFMSHSSIACDHFRPELAALPDAMLGRIEFRAIDIDENPSITEDLGVDAVPTLVIYKDCEELHRYEGPYSKEALKDRLETLLFNKPGAPQ